MTEENKNKVKYSLTFTFFCIHCHCFVPILYPYLVCSFSNLSVTSPTSQLILQPFRRFIHVKAHSPTLPLLHLRHSSFSNPSLASPTSQALYLIHMASRPSCVSLRRYRCNPYLPTGPSLTLGCVRVFLIYILDLGVFFVYVVFCVVSGGGPDFLITTDSGSPALVLLPYVLAPIQASDPRALDCKSYIGGRVNARRKKGKEM